MGVNSVDEVILKLCKAFNRIFNDFKGMYLFGTFLDGKMHEGEDIELVAIFDIEDKMCIRDRVNILWNIHPIQNRFH